MGNKNKLLGRFRDLQNNPYVFSRHELTQEPEDKKQEKYELTSKELEIVREQHLTIFEHDETMQKMFKNDFEEYFKAVEDPDLMEKKYQERMRDLRAPRDNEAVIEIDDLSDFMPMEEDDEYWDPIDEFNEFEMGMEDEMLEDSRPEDLEKTLSPKKNELYEKGFQWSVHIHKLCHTIYEKEKRRDPDLFRVMINATMVSAKIAYASDDDSFFEGMEGDDEFDSFEAELGLRGYGLATTFLQRTRDSLQNLIKKKFNPVVEWQKCLNIADEMILEIQGKMVELTKRLHPPRE
jgi:hypothetical protein